MTGFLKAFPRKFQLSCANKYESRPKAKAHATISRSSLVIAFSILCSASAGYSETRLYSVGYTPGMLGSCRKLAAARLDNLNTGKPLLVIPSSGNCTSGGLNTFGIYQAGTGRLLSLAETDQLHNDDGKAIAAVGDVNGDGISDFISGAPNQHSSASESDFAGIARVRSGADGSLLSTFPGQGNHAGYGFALSDLGQINGQRHALVCAIGSGGLSTLQGASYCEILNLITSSVRASIEGSQTLSYGFGAVQVGDLSGDGISEFVLASANSANTSAQLELRSASDGAVIGNGISGVAFNRFAENLWSLGTDANGVPLIAVHFLNSRELKIYRVNTSGFQYVRSYHFQNPFIYSAAAGGDYDGDEQADHLIGAATNSGLGVQIYSGATGQFIDTLAASQQGEAFGVYINSLGDINSDGRVDTAISRSSSTGYSMNLYSAGNRNFTETGCNLGSGDFVHIDRDVVLDSTVMIEGRIASASNSVVFLGFSETSWETAESARAYLDGAFPGCTTNLDAYSFIAGVSIATNSAGEFSFPWTIPNNPQLAWNELRMVALTANVSAGQLILSSDLVFHIRP